MGKPGEASFPRPELVIIAGAAAGGFGLPPLLLWIGHITGIVDFESTFEAGNGGIRDVAATVVLWCCALAPPIAVSVAVFAARSSSTLWPRLAAAVAAGLSGLAAIPLLQQLAGADQADGFFSAPLVGTSLGTAAALLVAAVPEVGYGIAAHAAIIWVLAFLTGTLYAGAVMLPDQGDFPILPMVVMFQLVLLSYRLVRRTGSRLRGVAAGVAGPVLAALAYILSPHTHDLLDAYASFAVSAFAIVSVPIMLATAMVAGMLPESHQEDANQFTIVTDFRGAGTSPAPLPGITSMRLCGRCLPLSLTSMSIQEFEVRTGGDKMDIDWLHDRLSTDTYWAVDRSRERVATAVAQSSCYGAFDAEGRQVGFARLVTDQVTFAWLSDVYVDRTVRGKGISKLLIEHIVADCQAAGMRRVLLATDDAAELYERYGFAEISNDKYSWMALTWPNHPA